MDPNAQFWIFESNFTADLLYSGELPTKRVLFFTLRLARTNATKIFVVAVGVINC